MRLHHEERLLFDQPGLECSREGNCRKEKLKTFNPWTLDGLRLLETIGTKFWSVKSRYMDERVVMNYFNIYNTNPGAWIRTSDCDSRSWFAFLVETSTFNRLSKQSCVLKYVASFNLRHVRMLVERYRYFQWRLFQSQYFLVNFEWTSIYLKRLTNSELLIHFTDP